MAQPKASAVVNAGYFLYHSDNNLPITEHANLGPGFGLNLALRPQPGAGFDFSIQIGMYYASQAEAMQITTSLNNPDITFHGNAKLEHKSFPIDFVYHIPLGLPFEVGAGLSVQGNNRTLTFPAGPLREDYTDSFNSLGLGAHAMARYGLPLGADAGSELYVGLLVRYIHNVWNSDSERDLSEFALNSLQANLGLGFAWVL